MSMTICAFLPRLRAMQQMPAAAPTTSMSCLLYTSRDGDEFNVALELAGAHDVGHEDKRTLQHAEKQGIFVLQTLIELSLIHISTAQLLDVINGIRKLLLM